MLVEEASKNKLEIFSNISEDLKNKIVEAEQMYGKLSEYNDLITYEELYDLTDNDKAIFSDIRNKAHDFEHELLHIKEDLLMILEPDIEWVLTNGSKEDDELSNTLRNSQIYYDFFKFEIILSLIFDKLKQLNVPRKKERSPHLHVHKSGGCC